MGNTTTFSAGYGFRILNIIPHSPAAESGLQPFLDFIVNIEVEDTNINEENTLNIQNFFKICQEYEDKVIHLTVYNIYSRQLRKTKIIPNKKWANADSLLGIMIRYEEYMTAIEKTFRVLQVLPNSFAEKLALEPKNDYIIGFLYHKCNDLDDFILKIKKNKDNLDVCVFNIRKNKIRFVNFGLKEGYNQLGCEFGGGIVNQLPSKKYEINLNDEFGLENTKPEYLNNYDSNQNLFHHELKEPISNETNTNKEILIEKPPKKQDLLLKEDNHDISSHNLLIEDKENKKNLDQILKQTNANAILEQINHKRIEHNKKHTPHKIPPRNPFETNQKIDDINIENIEIKNNVEEKNEIIKKEIENDGIQNEKHIFEQIEEKNILQEKKIETQNQENNINNEERKQQNVSFIDKNSIKHKMIMKYSFFCEKLKTEYIINSSDLFQFDLNFTIGK